MDPTLQKGDWVFVKKNALYKKIRFGDIIVFSPIDTVHNNKLIKRCIGLPSDTIEIKNGNLFRNNRYIKQNSIYHKRLSISKESDYRLDFLKNTPLFPKNKEFSYSIINFGPIKVPGKNVEIPINNVNRLLYNSISSNSFDLYNKYLGFKEDYYFVVGDNFFCSLDSRFWGFLPEENIIGKAVLVLFNHHNGKFRWDRFLKKIE